LVKFCHDNGIAVTGYCPLGGVKVDVMNDEFVKSVAETHRCTPAQVALSWALSRGIAVIPKTTSKLRLKENLKKIKLTFDEKHAFSWIKTHERKVDPGRDLKELEWVIHDDTVCPLI
ncbi:hypothetical protein GGI05_006465, partial [Coemansia sp. RSA 2603]